ncbi:MAG: ATP-binding cassette domain-containing protein [Myxococcales bacterium]|nr:ATP-binding cassette domain-containing protein [Myxococcales bacterium]
MSLLVLENAGLSFGDRDIFTELDLRVSEGERIGLVGANGSGKSTLLKVMGSSQALDKGKLQVSRGARIGYLPQDIELSSDLSLRDYVLSSVPGRAQLDEDLAACEKELEETTEKGGDDDLMMELATRLSEMHERVDHFERFYSEHEAMRILGGLGFETSDRDRGIGEFSGGWKMRAVLAALLFQQPDLMLLDEPTNHLDMPSVSWFSEFLKRYKRSFILISHDREFLNEQISKVVSFEVEGVRSYRGDYEAYKKQRVEEAEILANKAENLAREREHMQKFIDRFRAQANKAAAVQSRVKALAKMDDVERYQERRIMRFHFASVERTVNEVVRVSELAKNYDDVEVFKEVNLTVKRGEKIGIIGPNGAGKTTLLRIMAGELAATSGATKVGNKVEVGYYAQHHADTLHRESTVFEEVQRAGKGASPSRVRSVLGAFLFSGDDVDKPVSVLSGGERARVALARLLIRPGHLLLMDEPTNHLDLESSESLAQALSEFEGTLIFVSHNRSLIRTLATTIWNVEDGGVESYGGTLDEYMHSCRLRLESAGEGQGEAAVPTAVSFVPKAELARAQSISNKKEDDQARKRREADARKHRAKVIGPLEKKVASTESRIAEMEDVQAERSSKLADPSVYEDAELRNELLDAFQKGATKLAELNSRWEHQLEELEIAQAKFQED